MSRSAAVLVLVGLLATALLPAAARAQAVEGGLRQVVYTPADNVARLPTPDRIVVHKAARRLELLQGGEVLRSYKVALGLIPTGHKEREGDFRTPEGSYRLTRRNARSDYFLSIQISYPGPGDLKRAKEGGWEPGGAIMIHGMPNTLKREPTYYETRDWTDGCIAVSNADMVEIWMLTRNDLPIEIRP